ncbi:hypothetical protein RM572_04335 [Streptomyces sp. DSM 42041]|uniref:Uncharacterized protein n=1 Tax=Streptomyces hazeniae TaxID=3075538 RepID=A0ABU2NQV4_9ACTN|nr:hypothetical protein [Streptomyces sp. DSM 42041]MDT0378003.1 hypothetical protein [Streptomyces sp. DSM 42041]
MAVDLSFFRSETSQRLRAEGRAEDIVLLLEEREVHIPDEARHRITTCHDPSVLKTWFRRAITATTADEVFGGD